MGDCGLQEQCNLSIIARVSEIASGLGESLTAEMQLELSKRTTQQVDVSFEHSASELPPE